MLGILQKKRITERQRVATFAVSIVTPKVLILKMPFSTADSPAAGASSCVARRFAVLTHDFRSPASLPLCGSRRLSSSSSWSLSQRSMSFSHNLGEVNA